MITELRRALARRLDPKPAQPPVRRARKPRPAEQAGGKGVNRRAVRAAREAQKAQGRPGGRASSSMAGVNKYAFELSDEQIQSGAHRKTVGPMWDKIGRLQFDYLVDAGLKPEHRLLDIGCGAMRGGIHFARYLEPGHYYGIDVNESLIRAAIEHEVPQAGLQDRMPAANLRVTTTFEADFGVPFDFALAQSVFTHLPLNHIRLSLWQLAKVMPSGGRFFATVFIAPDDLPYDESLKQVTATTRPERDPFHYRVHELEWAATVADWDFTFVGDWQHPRGQQMAEFRRR